MIELEIRPTREADWAEVRALRIEMLQDAPTAFAESIDDALALDEAAWRARVRRSHREGSIVVAAIANGGTWVGMMGAYVPDGGTAPVLAAVYVRPEHRGSAHGVADRTLDVIESWCRLVDGARLLPHPRPGKEKLSPLWNYRL